MHFLKLSFRNERGETLAARLDLPVDEKPIAYALFAHCFTCTKNLNAVVNINQALAQEGIATLRFDFAGLGESDGDFSETSFSSNVSDLIAAADFLQTAFDAPKLLIGHSLGGAAVLQAATYLPSAVAVATIGAPSALSHLARHIESSPTPAAPPGEVDINLAGKKFRVRKQFLEDLQQTRMQETVQNLNRALLICHSPRDRIVGIENAAQLFRLARHPKSFISLDQADHLLSNREDALYVGTVLAAWARKYFGVSASSSPQRDLTDNRVTVRTGRKGYQAEIIANGHRLLADEPIAVGGSDTGPPPYDYLVAALGACTGMTLRMYADRKEWPLETAVVRLKHRKIHAVDCQECETGSGKIDSIEREIELEGPLDREQRQRLLEIADRCPVHRTLQGKIVVTSTLKE